MGTDIHIVLEMKHNDRWVGVHAFPSILELKAGGFGYHGWALRSRNYRFFAALAGVRDSGPEPRGLPSDLSDLSRALVDSWGSDGHSHTWYALDEIAPLVFQYVLSTEAQNEVAKEKLKGQYDPDFMFDLVGMSISQAEHRLIIWFDN